MQSLHAKSSNFLKISQNARFCAIHILAIYCDPLSLCKCNVQKRLRASFLQILRAKNSPIKRRDFVQGNHALSGAF
jgi:hypothetical protein